MKFVIISLLISTLAGNSTNFRNDEGFIYWKQDSFLKWTDFKGVPGKDSSVGAMSSLMLQMRYRFSTSGKLKYCYVNAIFDKNKSWVIVKEETGLSHEQTHFDIEEVFARKMRKAILDENRSTLNDGKMMLLYNSVKKELYRTQQEYDVETNYSRNFFKQQEWKGKIDKELESLVEYKSRIVIK